MSGLTSRCYSFDDIPNMSSRYASPQCHSPTNKRVHFDDEYVNYHNKGCYYVAEHKNHGYFQNTQLSVQDITSKLKHSYDNIKHGLGVLGKLYNDLRETRKTLVCNQQKTCEGAEQEISRLISEVEKLKHCLEKACSRKRKYLEELSRLQTTLHNDRKKMEQWTRSSRDSNRQLQTKIVESSKKTRDQQISIHKLKQDNAELWKILQEIQQHLHDERRSSGYLLKPERGSDVGTSSDVCAVKGDLYGSPKHLPKIPVPQNTCATLRVQNNIGCYDLDRASSEISKQSSDIESSTSSQDQYLCDKLKQLLEQSENVHKLISNVGKSRERSKSIEKNTECCVSSTACDDMSDIIRRCEALERKVEDCSTKDIRDKIMAQLYEIDNSNSSDCNVGSSKQGYDYRKSTCASTPQQPRQTKDCCRQITSECQRQSWNAAQHKKVRDELLMCLDKIICLEKNFADAQTEISNLQNNIKKTKSENETYKGETNDMRIVIDAQREDIFSLQERLNVLIKENETTSLIKSELEDKSSELEKLKSEMVVIFQAMDNLRVTKQDNAHFQDEISQLQMVIYEIEQQMQLLQDENLGYRADNESTKKLVQEIEIENQALINQLKLREEENVMLRSRIESAENEAYIAMSREHNAETQRLDNELKSAYRTLDEYKQTQLTENHDQKELISTLIDDNDKYLELLKHKDEIIDELRDDMNKMANLIEEKLCHVENDTAKQQSKEISQELLTIKQMLDTSHNDIADKVINLQKQLSKLQDENRSLRQNMDESKATAISSVSALKDQLGLLKNENITLRDTLNRPYPGIVDSVLSNAEEMKDLRDENELLRLAVNNDRKSLVDSNLRKRGKIKELEEKLNELNQVNSSLTPKQNKMSCSKQKNKQKDDFVSSPRDEQQFVDAMIKQNSTIAKLQEDNNKLRSKFMECKEEIEKLQKKNDNLQKSEEANIALENEISSLRATLQDMDSEHDVDVYKEKIKELEAEIRGIKSTRRYDQDGVSRHGSPDRSQLSLAELNNDYQSNLKNIVRENQALRDDLEKAQKDIRRLAKIADHKQNASSPTELQVTRMKKFEEKVARLEDENVLLRDNMRDMETTNKNSENEIEFLKTSLENCENYKEKQVEEINKLRTFIKDLHESKKFESKMDDTVKVLNETIKELQKELVEVEKKYKILDGEKRRLHGEVDSLKTKNRHSTERNQTLHDNNKELEEKLIQINRQLQDCKSQNKELQDICDKLTTEMERVGNDISETRIADWLDKDANRRLALLSPDSHRSDITFADPEGKQQRKEHVKLIRKLQIENQLMRGRLSNLEEEAGESSKIIADMERGHGHLTGVLRCHLILQKHTTAKLLESSLQQYQSEYEALMRSFHCLEDKFDKDKQHTKRRDHAWDLFTNASATIANIQTILNEGLVKVEEDLERDLTEQEFEEKDYKSRLWILRRRLSDVENRHRELQLRAEELHLRLDAKTTEFEVTQDELQDTTRDLETRDTSLVKLKSDVRKLAVENAKLKELITTLRDNQDKTVGAVLQENENLQRVANNQDNQIQTFENDVDEMLSKLDEKDKALNAMKKIKDQAERDIQALNNRISYLERKLKDITADRDKLQEEARNRAGYMGNSNDDHGTIHMLRDDLKRITKENANLKQDIVLKQRQMYDMSKDLHNMKMHQEIDTYSKDKKSKGEISVRMLQDVAELRAQKFLLETKLKDLERRQTVDPVADTIDEFFEKAFKSRLVDKEKEIEKLKREKTKGKSPNLSRDDTLSEVGLSFDTDTESKQFRDLRKQVLKLKEENQLLQGVIEQKGLNEKVLSEVQKQELVRSNEQFKTEVNTLSADIEKKQKRIKDLLKVVDELKDNKPSWHTKDNPAKKTEKTHQEEIQSLVKKLQQKDKELQFYKSKLESIERQLPSSTSDDKFQDTYLSSVTPTRNALLQTPHNGFLDRNTPLTPQILEPSPRSNKTDSGYGQVPNPKVTQEQIPGNLINLLDEPLYESLLPYEEVKENLRKEDDNKTLTDSDKKSSRDSTKVHSKIPVLPSKQKKKSSSAYEIPVEVGQQQKSEKPQRKKTTEPKKVNDSNSIAQRLNDEIDVYRSVLHMTDNNSLDNLDEDELRNVIDYQIYLRVAGDLKPLYDDIDDARQTNDALQRKLKHLQSIKFSYEMPNKSGAERGLKEKLDSTLDENSTLRDLLETQTQNIKSQQAVIRTLKTDMKEQRTIQKQIDDNTLLEQSLQEKKIEIKNLKKQIKENSKLLLKEKTKWKHDVKVLKARLKGEEHLTNKISIQINTIEDLNMTIQQLREKIITETNQSGKDINTLQKSLTNENLQFEKLKLKFEAVSKELNEKELNNLKLQEKLERVEVEYDIVLKNAESALENAKESLKHQKTKAKELKMCLNEQDNVLDNMKQLLEEKDLELSKLRHDKEEIEVKTGSEEEFKEKFHALKVEYNLLSKQHRNDTTVFNDVKTELEYLLFEKNEMLDKLEIELEKTKVRLNEREKYFEKKLQLTTQDLKSANDRLATLQDELLQSQQTYVKLEEEHSHIVDVNKALTETNHTLSKENASLNKIEAHLSNIDKTDGTGKDEDIEIEYEILKGCYEELEKDMESMKTKNNELNDQNIALRRKVKNNKDVLEGEENELKETKSDLEKTLGYLRDVSKQNEELQEKEKQWLDEIQAKDKVMESLETELSKLKTDNNEIDEMLHLKEKLLKQQQQQSSEKDLFENIIDEMEQEINSKQNKINELEVQLENNNKSNENEKQLRIESLEEVEKLRTTLKAMETGFAEEKEYLESLIKYKDDIKQEEIENLQKKLDKSTNKLQTLKLQLSEKTNELFAKQIVISCLESSLNDWINKSTLQAAKIDNMQNDMNKKQSDTQGHIEHDKNKMPTEFDNTLEEDENTDLCEVTPITFSSQPTLHNNFEDDVTITPPKVIVLDDVGNETFLIDGFSEAFENETFTVRNNDDVKTQTEFLKQMEEIRNLNMELNNLKINNQNITDQLNDVLYTNENLSSENEQKEEIIEDLTKEIVDLEEELENKKRELQTLTERTKTDAFADDDAFKKIEDELTIYKEENKELKNRILTQKTKHEVELESLKATLLKLKEENVYLLKADVEENIRDQLNNQLKIRRMEEQLLENESKINNLMDENKNLRKKLPKVDGTHWV